MSKKLLYFLALLTIGVYGQIPTNQRVKEYLFTNGSLSNTSPPGGSLVATGSARVIANDPLNQQNALQLNGDSFDAGIRSTVIDTERGDVTISFWVKTSDISAVPKNIMQQYGSAGFGNYGWFVQLIQGKVQVQHTYVLNHNSIASTHIFDSGVIADNDWHHIGFTFKRAGFHNTNGVFTSGVHTVFYVDGQKILDTKKGGNSTAMSAIHMNPSTPIKIAEGSNKYTEVIDNIRVYNRALSAAEIGNLNNEFPFQVSYVDFSATGTNSGKSWTNAYTNLHDALSDNSNEIWVRGGVYTPHASDRNINFSVIKNKKIYGGFTGTETDLSQRDIKANVTVFSGDLNNNDNGVFEYTDPVRLDNSYHVFNIGTSVSSVTFDGITISGGHANNPNGGFNSNGAAIFKEDNAGTDIIIKNTIIKNNTGRNTAGINAGFYNSGSLLIENCEFINNVSSYAASFYCVGFNNSTVNLTVSNSLFAKNYTANIPNVTNGISGSDGWVRATGTSNMTANFTNNTYAGGVNVGTAVSHTLRGLLGIGRVTATSVLNVEINNSIFLPGNGGAKAFNINVGSDLYANSVVVTNSLSADNFPLATAKSNIVTTNPNFTDITNNDFTLQASSPAIDAGDNTKLPANIVADLLGNNRIHNTTVDMGAFEYGATTLSANNTVLINDFYVYPNPATELIKLNLSEELKKAEVYNFSGQKVKTSLIKTININDLSTGVYFLKITTENNKIGIKKFIKK